MARLRPSYPVEKEDQMPDASDAPSDPPSDPLPLRYRVREGGIMFAVMPRWVRPGEEYQGHPARGRSGVPIVALLAPDGRERAEIPAYLVERIAP